MHIFKVFLIRLDLYGSNVELYLYYGDFEEDDSENQSKFMDRIPLKTLQK